MATQNLATKYSGDVDEVFRLASLTNDAVNHDYDWDGVNSINIYGVGTASMNTYQRSGTNRYGVPAELGTTKTSYALTRDRAFTYTIDKRNREESMNVTDAGKSLRRQIEVVITPEIDIYRLASWDAAVSANSAYVNTGATTSSNAYSDFLAVNQRLSDLLVPLPGRIAFMTWGYYSLLKQSNFVQASDTAQADRKSGDLGMVDGVKVVTVPSTYMPGNDNLIITHPIANTSPMVLTDYIIHENAPGYNGHLVEGRVVYDNFALTNKVNAMSAHKTS
jgi:hypothetical protein